MALALVAGGLTLALLEAPTARADQVPADSGLYMHVGDNLFKQPFPNDTGGYLRLITDGDFSSRHTAAPLIGGAGSISTGNCQAWNLSSPSVGINTTYVLPSATVDFVRLNFMVTGSGIGGSQNFCYHAGVNFEDGTSRMILPIQSMTPSVTTSSRDVWANFTANTVTSVWIATAITSCNCGGATRNVHVFEVEGYLKNSTTSDPILNIANQAASNTECLPSGPTVANFASDTYTAPLGTFYVMTPAIMPVADTSPPNTMQIFTSFSGVTSQFYGWSRVIPDITGSPDVAVAIWKVTTLQPGLPIFVKPANNATGSAAISSTDIVCRFERVGNMYSSTLSNGYITAPLTNWGGGATDLWGIVHMANGYPINSVEDTDLSGTGGLFSQENMTFGPQLFATGTVGQSTTLSLDSQPAFSRSGNAYLVALGQHVDANGSSVNFHLQVNGLPAQAIMNGRSTTNDFEYAVFLVDDVAVRNGASNENGTIGQSFHRPFESESYQLTLGSGYDPTFPVHAGNTFGLLGHPGLTCLTICSSNMLTTSFSLPAEQTNSIRFHTQRFDGTPLPGVRVLLTNNSTALTTDTNGDATFTNSFVDAHFTLTKQGYVSLCADYRFRNSPGTQSGTGANGCPWLAAYDATFEVTMLTLQEANAGNSGSISIGGAASSPPTIAFEGNTTRIIPDRIEINITRTHNADLFVGLDKVDPTSGLVQHNVIRAMYWKAFESNTFAFFYPGKARSTSQEIGLHVLWVINDTGVVLNHTKFFLVPSGGSVGDYDVTITSDFVRGIEEKGYISAQQTFQSQYQASILAVQKSVRDQVYEDFQKVSDYGWFVIGFLLFLATVRAFRR